MTRDEALQRLEGTWTFEMARGRVRVRDESLLLAIDAVREEARRSSAPPVGEVRPS